MTIENVNTLKGLIAKANRVMGIGKKLTTKNRKKINKTTFCGPNKSFPVLSREYVAVARAYLGKSKLSNAAKENITACINKKAKVLGYKTTKKAKAGRLYLIYIELSYEQKQLYMSEAFATTRILVEDSLNTPDMELNEIDIIV